MSGSPSASQASMSSFIAIPSPFLPQTDRSVRVGSQRWVIVGVYKEIPLQSDSG